MIQSVIVMIKSALLVVALAAITIIWATAATPTDAATPVFGAAMDFGTGCLLGGAQDKKFIQPEVATTKVNGGETYKIYSLYGKLGTAVGTKPESIGIPCEDVTAIKSRPSYENKEVIGLGGNWAGMPRVPIAVNTSNATYRTAVRDLLKARGLANPNVKIDQIYRIDLEGDGVMEAIVSATYWSNEHDPQTLIGPSPDAKAGDYSILFMRKVVQGQVKTIVLAENVYKQDAEFVAPNEYRIRGIVDINGDGKMEILMYGAYYEGHWTSVFEVTGTEFKEVMSCGCGV